ncbi:MAG: helix-turn-helix domain-containing protein [Candidatus Nitrosopolaris sp.]
MDIIENRYRMIIEPERSGKTVSDVCIAFGVSRETWYKWKRRYDTYGIDGLKNQSRKPHNIKNLPYLAPHVLTQIQNEGRQSLAS